MERYSRNLWDTVAYVTLTITPNPNPGSNPYLYPYPYPYPNPGPECPDPGSDPYQERARREYERCAQCAALLRCYSAGADAS